MILYPPHLVSSHPDLLQITTKSQSKAKKTSDDIAATDDIVALDEGDIQLLKTYGQGPYARQLRTIEKDLKNLQQRIGEKMGVRESDTGLAPPNLWDTAVDRQRMGEESSCLQVARCTKIIRAGTEGGGTEGTGSDPEARRAAAAAAAASQASRALPGSGNARPNADEEDKYVINVKQIAKFVVGLGERVAPTDIEEGMRVG